MALLDGLRVVEVALLAPNMLGMHLADLGAEVIKVEDPQRGDYTRHIGAASASGVSFMHLRWNRGKRSIAVDLRTDQGTDIFRALVAQSEVVIEGLRPGALERRGLGYEALLEVQPALVFCSLSGFGQTGPYRDLATHGVAYDAFAGSAQPERTEDGFATIPRRYSDIGTNAGALYAAMGVLAAVVHARATGEGTRLDIAQADAAVVWGALRIDPLLSGVPRGQRGPDLTESVRYQYYDTSDGKTILFQASEQHFFERFARAVGREDLLAHTGAEFGEHASGNRELRAELAALFRTRTQAEWLALLLDADVPGGPAHSPASLLEDPQFRARTQVVEHEHPDAGVVRMLGTPVHTDAPHFAVRPAPDTGADTDEVLRDVLGYDDEQISALRRSAAIA